MKKAFSLLMVLMILMGCVAVFPVIGSASSDALSAQAYILNNGDETNTHIYVVFNKKITDYSTAVLYNRTVNGEVLAEVLSTIAQENEYTLKYTIAAGTSYVVPWKFTNVSGSLHYTVTPKAGEAELPLADTAGIRNGDTGWAEVATPCYTVSYEVVTSIKDIPGFESEEPPVHTHTPGEATRENVVDAQIGVEGSYDEVVRCSECNEVLSSTHKTIPALIAPLTGKVYTVKGDRKLYLVFDQKVTLTGNMTLVLGPASILTELAVVVNDTILSVDNSDPQFNLADILKNGWSGAPQQAYIWDNNVVGENGAVLPMNDKVSIWGQERSLYLFEYAGEAKSIYELTGEEHNHTPGEATRENVIDAQIGVEGSYDEVVRCTECGEIVSSTHVTIPALKALSAKVYTIAGESKLYIVFSKKVSLDPENGTTLVLGPAGILSEQAVQIDEYTIAVDNSDPQFNLATILKNGWDGVEQKAYIWSNNVATADGEKLPMNDKVTVWGEERSLYLLTYEGEYSTIEDVPTGDASLTVFGMILVVSAIGIGVTTKKKKVS